MPGHRRGRQLPVAGDDRIDDGPVLGHAPALIMVDREGHAFASMGLLTTAKDAIRFG